MNLKKSYPYAKYYLMKLRYILTANIVLIKGGGVVCERASALEVGSDVTIQR